MIAFVLSGGGNRGGLEVGAMWELLEQGIRPQMLVGTSAGAINAAGLAADLTLEGVRRLAEGWLEVTKDDVYPGNFLTTVIRFLLKRDGLYPNHRLYRFIRSRVPSGIHTFADVSGVRLYITAVDLNTGGLRVFGDDPADSVIDAIMASTALLPYLPPWEYQGRQYIDGGAGACLPLSVAIERGATEVYAVDLTYGGQLRESIHGVIPILFQAADIMVYQLRQRDLAEARRQLGDKLHYIPMPIYKDLSPFDFSHTRKMVEEGRQRTAAYLEAEARASQMKGGEGT
ncbi:MAG TPA: hypothetical protein EYH31_10955 [Anaerolineae bacterium]|nr:hypothetical protein [Anaerolineae bacterium]